MNGEGVRPAEKPKLMNRRKFLGLGLGVALTACVPSSLIKVLETVVTSIPTPKSLPIEHKLQPTAEPTKQNIVIPTENNVSEKPKSTEPGPVETVTPTSNPDILSPENTHKIEMTDVEPLPSNPGIMFLGDSLISLGSIPTYVASSLEAKNKTAYFVGDIQSSGNKVPYEGHGGFNTARFVEQLTDDNIKTWTELNGKQTTKNFNQHIPDIVVIQLGTNDAANIALFKKNGTSINIDTYTISNYKKIIDYLRSKNPHVRIIISKVPLTQHNDVNQFATEINSHYDQMVSELSTKVSPVVTTPDWTNYLDPNKNLADDYHPNSAGQKIMADRFTEMILQMMYSPKQQNYKDN